MNKSKITCFHYKKYDDIYVDNVKFTLDKLLLVLNIFPNEKVIALIDSDIDFSTILSSIGENVQMSIVSNTNFGFIAICNKKELSLIFKHTDIHDLEGLFIADFNKDVIFKEVVPSLENIASSMVKKNIADISLSVNFTENEMIISLSKSRYSVSLIKDIVRSIF